MFLTQHNCDETKVTDIDYVINPSFADIYQYQQMVKTDSNIAARALILSISEWNDTTDNRNERLFKVEKLEPLILQKESSFYFETFVEEVCKPYVSAGVDHSKLPSIATTYKF